MKLDANPDSPGLWVLSELERGPAYRDELFDLAHYRLPTKKAQTVPYVVGDMQAHGLILWRAQFRRYEIRESGREALAQLRAGKPVYVGESTPNCRIFAHDFTEAARDGGTGNRSPRAAA